MISLSTSLKYYKRKDVQEALVREAGEREIAVKYGDTGFGKRPDVLRYPADVLEFAKQGATSFHCSEELWHNPLQVTTGMPRQELDNLRKGWDLLIDIDCSWFEYSQAAAHIICQAFEHHGIQHFGLKFSGNHGFHIGIPWKAIPEQVQNKLTKNQFPEGPRMIAAYLQEFTRNALAQFLLSQETIQQMSAKTKKGVEELIIHGKFDPYKILTIDTVLIASRHLYRMAYSLNEKSGLVSIPLEPKEILSFKRENAAPEKVLVQKKFLSTDHVLMGEAKQLFVQADDYHPRTEQEYLSEKKEFIDNVSPQAQVSLQYFPPCMQNILKPLQDGKKRSMFALINFLHSVGWNHEQIEVLLKAWNKQHPQPLPEVLILGQVRYHKQQNKKNLPPNCYNRQYYVELGFCKPDNFCARIKNPASYAIFKQRTITELEKKPAKTKKSKEPTQEKEQLKSKENTSS